MSILLYTRPAAAIPITTLAKTEYVAWLKKQSPFLQEWLEASNFQAKPGQFSLLPSKTGKPGAVVAVIEQPVTPWSIAHLAEKLPEGVYFIDAKFSDDDLELLATGWALATYRFTRYRKNNKKKFPSLALPASLKKSALSDLIDGIFLARELINTPTNDMGPTELAQACMEVARECGAKCSVIVGNDLLKQNYPAVHAVGRASADAPRLIDLQWGNPKHPKVTLVGKGVCFDSGGLDIKPASAMKLMKKDMGGAATLLGLARTIMRQKLPVRLRLLVPAVENAISGNAFRPFDIINTRKGLTVEIGNTDAEGRLILCDAITEAESESPDLLIDCATLTGAARTALGPDIPAFFTPDDDLAAQLADHSKSTQDHVWRLPLWQPYRALLTSSNADIVSCDDTPFAGAITAALFLKEFVNKTKRWVHIDMMAWNVKSLPGRPQGGEAMALRALFSLIRSTYPS